MENVLISHHLLNKSIYRLSLYYCARTRLELSPSTQNGNGSLPCATKPKSFRFVLGFGSRYVHVVKVSISRDGSSIEDGRLLNWVQFLSILALIDLHALHVKMFPVY